jgi:hypothetical protein
VASAVRARVPTAPLAGPAAWCTGGEGWFQDFLARSGTPLAFATAHYYPMGRTAESGSDETATITNMLSPALMARSQACLGAVAGAARSRGLALRVDETNSAYGFGQPGVSDVFASALWAIDYLHTLAELGVAGVNIQTGTDENGGLGCGGVYLPFCRDNGRWRVRPLYYGMLLFHQAAAGRAVPLATTSDPAANVVAHAVLGDDGSARVVLLNKEARATAMVTLVVTPAPTSDDATVLRLRAPSLFARDSITLGESAVADDGTWTPALVPPVRGSGGTWSVVLPPASAAVVTVGAPATPVAIGR